MKTYAVKTAPKTICGEVYKQGETIGFIEARDRDEAIEKFNANPLFNTVPGIYLRGVVGASNECRAHGMVGHDSLN